MENKQIAPEKITKPIQLLGAWLVGLLTVDASFLFAATNMDINSWQSGALTIAAIANVPIFIGALFLLQTKFRPELQEDSYYATYLNNRTNEVIQISKTDIRIEELGKRIENFERKSQKSIENSSDTSLSNLSFGINSNLKNQDEIESALSSIGIFAVKEFGEDDQNLGDLKVAVAVDLPKNIQKDVLIMARKLGFKYYSLIEPWEDIEEDVLFGAYGKSEGKISFKDV